MWEAGGDFNDTLLNSICKCLDWPSAFFNLGDGFIVFSECDPKWRADSDVEDAIKHASYPVVCQWFLPKHQRHSVHLASPITIDPCNMAHASLKIEAPQCRDETDMVWIYRNHYSVCCVYSTGVANYNHNRRS
jgi:hypothetical protein